MANLDLLMVTLEVTENPGLDTLDPRFQEFVTLVGNEDYQQIVVQAENFFSEGIYDVRILGYYAYGAFLDGSFQNLIDILGGFSNMLRDNWDALGPIKKKEKHTQVSTNWFLSKLIDKLIYHEQKADDTWNYWVDSVSSDDVELILEGVNAFRKSLMFATEAPKSMESLNKLQAWLKELQKLVYREPEPEPEPEPEAEPEPEGQEHSGVLVTQNAVPSSPIFEASFHMQMLIRKLKAFERMVEIGDFAKAAVISSDVTEIIENFDPKIYFPKIFSKYLSLMTNNIDEICSYWDERDSIAWQMREQLYKSDLDAFVAL